MGTLLRPSENISLVSWEIKLALKIITTLRKHPLYTLHLVTHLFPTTALGGKYCYCSHSADGTEKVSKLPEVTQPVSIRSTIIQI